MSDLQREPQQHNLPSIFYQNEDGNFCLCCCCYMHLFFVVAQDGVSWLSALLVQQVSCTLCMAQVSCGCMFLLFFHKFFIACFVAFLDVLVAGDLRHEYAQSAWGFPFRGPPGYWLRSLRLRCGNWCSFDNDCHSGMSIVVILTTSSRRLCCVHWQGRLVTLRLIAPTLLIALEELSLESAFVHHNDGIDCIRGNWWWLLSCPSQFAMLLLPVVACCDCA
jgi:hypothetical protein